MSGIEMWEENLKKKYNIWVSSTSGPGFGFKSWTRTETIEENENKRWDLQIFFWKWQINLWWRGK